MRKEKASKNGAITVNTDCITSLADIATTSIEKKNKWKTPINWKDTI